MMLRDNNNGNDAMDQVELTDEKETIEFWCMGWFLKLQDFPAFVHFMVNLMEVGD